MKKIFQALALTALVAIPIIAFAAAPAAPVFRPDAGTFYSAPKAYGVDQFAVGIQMPGTAVAPSLATDGIAISTLKATFDVYIEVSTNPPGPADDAGTYDPSGAGDAHDMKTFAVNTLPNFVFQAYLLNPNTNKWSRAPGLDVTVTGGATTFVKTGIIKPTDISTRLAYAFPATVPCPMNAWIMSKR